MSTDSPTLCVTQLPSHLQAVAVMLSDQTTAHLRLFSSISPLALLASFTCSFFKCVLLFFSWFPNRSLPPGCSGTPVSPSWAVNIKEAPSWTSADFHPTAASSEPGSVLLKQPHQGQPEYHVPWSVHGSVSEADRASYGVITAVSQVSSDALIKNGTFAFSSAVAKKKQTNRCFLSSRGILWHLHAEFDTDVTPKWW